MEEVRDDGPAFRQRALAAGRYVRLTVRDTGTGMDAATLARATEPFFTIKPPGKGTGLGVPMAKQLAEQSGGGFALESASGQGTAVTLWFPEAGQAAAEGPETGSGHGRAGPPASAHDGAGAHTVLVVDDDPGVRETLADQLVAAGLHVIAAADGASALVILDGDAAVDVLMTDLTMSGLDGLALIQEARRRRPGLPALLLTGEARELAPLAAKGPEGGRFDPLRKPASSSRVLCCISALLETAPPSQR